MPRPNNKRKAGEIDFDDPMSYVIDYCNRHRLPEEAGNSAAEKDCAQRAAEAREDYKMKRDSAASEAGNSTDAASFTGTGLNPEDRNERKGLSPAQKYTIRLQNNRKSANASKVYNEILKRELSHCLQKLTAPGECLKCKEFNKTQDQRRESLKRVRILGDQLAELRDQLKKEKRFSMYQEARCNELTKRLQALQEKPGVTLLKTEGVESRPRQLGSVSPPALPSSQEAGHGIDPSSVPSEPARSQTTTVDKSESPDETGLRIPGNEVLPTEAAPSSLAKSECQTQQEATQSGEPLTLRERLLSSQALYSLSPAHESDQRELFRSGMTYTQSQNDDTDDKAQLNRNLPTSGGIPVSLMCSQPSQSDIGAGGAFKSSLGSDDMALGDPNDLYISSQGTSGGARKATQTSS